MGEFPKLTKWVYLIIIPIHIIFIAVLLLTDIIPSTKAIPLITVWLIINYAFGLYCCIIADACFTLPKSTLGKIFCYPAGAILLLMILAGVSFPVGLIGVIISSIPH